MLKISIALSYPILIIVSIGKKSFVNLGRYIDKSGDTLVRLLFSTTTSLEQAQKISLEIFQGKKNFIA